jgi:hypothetical protein
MPVDRTTQGTLVVATVTAVWLGIVAVAALDRAPWGDEQHYLQTIQRFGQDMGLETLQRYPGELAPPLAFALYAWWGRLVGFALPRLRVLSLVIAFLSVLAVHGLARRVLRHDRAAAGVALFFLLHPYTIGLSVFIFNDMLAILCTVLLAIGIAAGRPWLVVLASAAGLMTRQYLVFLTAATAVHAAIRWVRWRRPGDLALLVGLVASAAPLAAMFVLWRGLAPANAMRALYLAHGLSFKTPALTLYVTQLFTYLCPLLALRPWTWARHSWPTWIGIGGVSCLYWLAPMRPAAPQVAAGIDTVGLLHRAILAVVGVNVGDLVFWIAFALGLAVLASIVAAAAPSRAVAAWPNTHTFLAIAVCAFLAMMPWSYMHWEKYFMPLLPLAAVLVLATRDDQNATPGEKTAT